MALETGDFHRQPEARVFPFIEQMGVWSEVSRKEFWWEREWRHVGRVHLDYLGCLFLCPEKEIEYFALREEGEPMHKWNRRKRRFIDPSWGLEWIIAHLAGMPKRYITPFDD